MRKSMGMSVRMEFRFNAQEWARLSTSERIYRCRVMQEEALKLANQATADVRADYLALAEQWGRLAADLAKGPSVPL